MFLLSLAHLKFFLLVVLFQGDFDKIFKAAGDFFFFCPGGQLYIIFKYLFEPLEIILDG